MEYSNEGINALFLWIKQLVDAGEVSANFVFTQWEKEMESLKRKNKSFRYRIPATRGTFNHYMNTANNPAWLRNPRYKKAISRNAFEQLIVIVDDLSPLSLKPGRFSLLG